MRPLVINYWCIHDTFSYQCQEVLFCFWGRFTHPFMKKIEKKHGNLKSESRKRRDS